MSCNICRENNGKCRLNRRKRSYDGVLVVIYREIDRTILMKPVEGVSFSLSLSLSFSALVRFVLQCETQRNASNTFGYAKK
jgi:hypothetical protein